MKYGALSIGGSTTPYFSGSATMFLTACSFGT